MKLKYPEAMKDKLFFTADNHYSHAKIIEYCHRPFKDAHEMNKVLIENWNNKVPKDGIVIHCGDFSFREPEIFLPRLNGRVVLIFGNHDKTSIRSAKKNPNLFEATCDLLDLTVGDKFIVCSHYCFRVWNRSHYNSWSIFGHQHSKEPSKSSFGKSWDVGVDGNDFTPVSFSDLEKIMEKRPDNPNLIKKK